MGPSCGCQPASIKSVKRTGKSLSGFLQALRLIIENMPEAERDKQTNKGSQNL